MNEKPVIISSVNAIRKQLDVFRSSGQTIGLVPTMGNLHQGHFDLIEEASRRADRIVVSIFVNPMQFGPHEDFDAYPRTLKTDCNALDGYGCDIIFAPTVREIYPKGINTEIDVPSLSSILCGQNRPGHFKGVATVVAKLLNIVQPNVAVFGIKDYQQLQVIKTMVSDLQMPVEIVGADITREPSGLAMSSRNTYLSKEERSVAGLLHQSLIDIGNALKCGRDVSLALKTARQSLKDAGFTIDYIEIHNAADLNQPLIEAEKAVILIAAKLGKARLIDNLIVPLGSQCSGGPPSV